ncbi:MAG: response regulator transcription factor [Ignavibacteriales bacterium]|nr:response regulator transcription factor [Ignavibacteriales bacterium]MCF8306707.1 response regulator transcription factor [Ignavibacteriales bacterium]MCF8316193.1 response regulator transcription factor [Ignavibacteriales bacterium]MCF8437777.1 response regulator transcription factor [Ignavibacteriales bacterium]
MLKETKIIVADDHPIFREGLLNIIKKESSFNVIATACSGTEAWELIKAKKPAVVILDISMPGLNGLDVAKLIKDNQLDIRPIILTMYSEPEYLDEALENGVTGYLLKDATLNEINDCIKTVINGGYFISKELQDHLIHGAKFKQSKDDIINMISTLSTAEKKVLKLLSMNKTSVQIAEEMFISFRTVQNHRTNISNKLDLHGHNSLLLFAIKIKAYL